MAGPGEHAAVVGMAESESVVWVHVEDAILAGIAGTLAGVEDEIVVLDATARFVASEAVRVARPVQLPKLERWCRPGPLAARLERWHKIIVGPV